jgi:hypothetical protein
MSNGRELPSVWTSLVGSLPLFAVALLVASVAYDYAFLMALGLTLDELPSSLSEHVRSAVIWAPKVSIALILCAVVELALRRIEGGRTEEELIASSPEPRFTRTFRRSGDAAVWIGSAIAAVLGPFFSTDSGWVFLSFMVLWGSLTFSVLGHPRMSAKFDSVPKRLLLVAPVLISIVCMQGHAAGASLQKAAEPSWEAMVKLGDETTVHPLLGIRRFTTFAVAVKADRRVWLLPNEAILSVRSMKAQDISTLNACRWWQVLCATAVKK